MLRDQSDPLGHDATIVSDSIEAMRTLFERPHDVVRTGLGMLERDGFAPTGDTKARTHVRAPNGQ